MKSIDLKMTSVEVNAETRSLHTKWTREMVADLQSIHTENTSEIEAALMKEWEKVDSYLIPRAAKLSL